MTTQQLETSENVNETRMSTADLAKSMTGNAPVPVQATNGENEPLFASNEAQNFRSQWERIQAGFVDEPRRAVEQADELVANTIKKLAEVFAAERSKMEGAWGKNEDVSTEDLRVALRRYRSFFNRLLSV